MEPIRYDASALFDYAIDLLCKAGLASGHAQAVARTLVDGDLLGHDTHGLALLPGYLKELEQGAMTREGSPQIVSDYPAALLWMAGACLVQHSCTRVSMPSRRAHANSVLPRS